MTIKIRGGRRISSAALDRAAAPIYKSIEADAERLAEPLRSMLTHLRTHLFDDSLSVASMLEAAGIRSDSARTEFRRRVGRSPKEYVAERRLEVAVKLLRAHPQLAAHRLAEVLGWTPRAFVGACRKRYGVTPHALRKQLEREALPEPTRSPPAISQGVRSADYIKTFAF